MASRRRSGLAIVAVLLVVGGLVAAGLYAVDRWAQGRFERQVAENLRTSLGTPNDPEVSVEGSPFLTQAVTRNIHLVHVVADDLGAGGATPLPVEHVDFVATDVTTTDWFRTMTASHIEGVGLLDYAALEKVAKLPLSYAGDGRIQTQTSTKVFGADVVAHITGVPRLERSEQTLTFADPTITVGGVNLPDFTAKALLRAVLTPIPLSGLPLGLRVSSVAAEEGGVRVGVTADDVAL